MNPDLLGKIQKSVVEFLQGDIVIMLRSLTRHSAPPNARPPLQKGAVGGRSREEAFLRFQLSVIPRLRCPANLEQKIQPRPDYGLDLSHFQHESL